MSDGDGYITSLERDIAHMEKQHRKHGDAMNNAGIHMLATSIRSRRDDLKLARSAQMLVANHYTNDFDAALEAVRNAVR